MVDSNDGFKKRNAKILKFTPKKTVTPPSEDYTAEAFEDAGMAWSSLKSCSEPDVANVFKAAMRATLPDVIDDAERAGMAEEFSRVTRANIPIAAIRASFKYKKQQTRSLRKPSDGLTDDSRVALAALNQQYTPVMLSGRTFRLAQKSLGPGKKPKILAKQDFVDQLAPEKVLKVSDKGSTLVPLTKTWLEWSDRKPVGTLVFKPPPLAVGRNAVNVWSGLAVQPQQGDWSQLNEHIKLNICNGVEDHYNWLMTWFAHMVQFPGKKTGSAVVLRGLKGIGKSKLCEWVAELFGEHALKVSDTNQFLGNFNALLSGVVFLTAEEAFFAGDKRAEQVMKDMLTSGTMAITFKNADSEIMDNHLHVVMVGNDDWQVPASLKGDERRFFVLDVAPNRIQDTRYFGAIDHQMGGAGLRGMLFDLLQFKPAMWGDDGWDILRKPIVTESLIAQARESASPSEAFFLRLVTDGEVVIAGKGADDDQVIELHEDKENRIDRADLRSIYEQTIKEMHRGRYAIGNDGLFDRLAKDWLSAKDTLEDGTMFLCPSLSAIRASVRRRKGASLIPVTLGEWKSIWERLQAEALEAGQARVLDGFIHIAASWGKDAWKRLREENLGIGGTVTSQMTLDSARGIWGDEIKAGGMFRLPLPSSPLVGVWRMPSCPGLPA